MMMVSGLVFLFVLNWELTLILLASVPVVAGATALLSRLNARTTAASLSASAAAVSVAEECFAATQTVHVFHMAQHEARRYARIALQATGLLTRLALLNGVGDWVVFGVFNVVVVGAMFFAGSQVLGGRSSVGATVTFLLVMFDLMMEMERLPEALYSLSSGVGAARRIAQLLEDGETEAAARRMRLARAAEMHEADNEGANGDWAVVFEDVRFAYPTRDGEVLHGATLRVVRGESVALCGASGCGKTTLLSLLFGAYAPDAGTVRLHGRSVRGLDAATLRAGLALVPQEPLLFNTSVARNISYGATLSQAEIEEAATRANAHEFVAALPRGYSTRVGSRGLQLSGGQRQRLCIARALAAGRGSVLCLDEPTSSLDWASALAVCHTLRELLARRDRAAVLLVTHQPALLRHVDRVVFIADGTVAAEGSHDDLCERVPAYRELFGL
jgi:ABC-type multidrug transport system fused ATPase/permease subunit